MNANELADLLEVDSWYKLVTREEIATMLRQQEAEINRLKLLCISYIDEEWSGTSSYQAKIDEVKNEQ